MSSLKGYLTVIGYVKDSTQVTWRLGYITSTGDPTYAQRLRTSKHPPVSVSQIDASGVVISSYPIPTNDIHTDPSDQDVFFFAGKLPLDTSAQQLTLALQGNMLSSFTIPARHPFIGLTWRPTDQLTGQQTITWEARHPNGAPMEYLVSYSNDGGRTFRPVSQSITETSYVANFDLLPGGSGQIMVQATDGGNTASALSPIFALPERPVYSMILSPADQARVQGKWVTLRGQGYYLEEDRPELSALEWTSSLDGKIGNGRIIQVKLSPGAHTITLVAGRGSRQGSASITLHAT